MTFVFDRVTFVNALHICGSNVATFVVEKYYYLLACMGPVLLLCVEYYQYPSLF